MAHIARPLILTEFIQQIVGQLRFEHAQLVTVFGDEEFKQRLYITWAFTQRWNTQRQDIEAVEQVLPKTARLGQIR
ncbi:Uncharacterised protein [Vibrio cholerae]|nr:Uncharacterised protein [Vibrio cholerae]